MRVPAVLLVALVVAAIGFRSAAMGLLVVAETDGEAIRLGQGYGYDQDAVLELRERGLESVSLGPGEGVTVRRFGFRVDLKPGTD